VTDPAIQKDRKLGAIHVRDARMHGNGRVASWKSAASREVSSSRNSLSIPRIRQRKDKSENCFQRTGDGMLITLGIGIS